MNSYIKNVLDDKIWKIIIFQSIYGAAAAATAARRKRRLEITGDIKNKQKQKKKSGRIS